MTNFTHYKNKAISSMSRGDMIKAIGELQARVETLSKSTITYQPGAAGAMKPAPDISSVGETKTPL